MLVSVPLLVLNARLSVTERKSRSGMRSEPSHVPRDVTQWDLETSGRTTCRRSLTAALILVATLCNLVTLPASDRWEPNGVIATFSIPSDGRLLRVPVIVDGKERTFLLDTGFTYSTFDYELARHLTPLATPGILKTQGEDVRISRYRAPAMSVGTTTFDWVKEVNAIDLAPLVIASESEFDGILGMDALQKVLLHLDFDRNVALLCNPRLSGEPPGSRVALDLDLRDIPGIRVQLPTGASAVFELDTGYNESAQMTPGLFDSLKKSRDILPTGMWSRFTNADNKESTAEKGRCSNIGVSGYEHKGIIVVPGRSNMLGLSYLCRYRVTFDFVNGRLFLDPASRFDVRDRRDSDGIALDTDKVVRYVAKASVGERAGMKIADKIVLVDGMEASAMSRSAVNRVLGFPRFGELRIKVERQGKLIEIVLPR